VSFNIQNVMKICPKILFLKTIVCVCVAGLCYRLKNLQIIICVWEVQDLTEHQWRLHRHVVLLATLCVINYECCKNKCHKLLRGTSAPPPLAARCHAELGIRESGLGCRSHSGAALSSYNLLLGISVRRDWSLVPRTHQSLVTSHQ
jgi:hypothetical protein